MFLPNLRQLGFTRYQMAPPRSSARFTARMIKGATPGEMPGFIEPALATRRDEAPVGEKWVHEVKYDGWRVQAHLNGGEVTLFTRRGHNWTKQFYSVAADVTRLPANKLILDGEVVATDAKGMPSYGALTEDLKPDQVRRLAYFVFDLLFMDGFDLRRANPHRAEACLTNAYERGETVPHPVQRTYRTRQRSNLQKCLSASA